METIYVRNVCEAIHQGVNLLLQHGHDESSRAGLVLVMPHPVVTVYEKPRERVLFSPLRDANPFFHLAESLWMLAGRRDAAFLNNFVSDFGERFAEKTGNVHGAYGHRWREMFGVDQLNAVVAQLSNSPGSRQAVISMWDPTPCRGDDLCGRFADRPCNTHAYLRLQEGKLELTILCRSNDIWWGAYGANAVHFSILQEYLAARLDVEVGRMYQFSNNFHMYHAQIDQLQERRHTHTGYSLLDDLYSRNVVKPLPLVHDVESFDEEVRLLLKAYEGRGDIMLDNFHNHFLSTTAWPMLMAHRHRRSAQTWLEMIEASDWRTAARGWIERRTR